ncbi:BlaI/MecI/CopY family transcriptional regulator [Akkermansiaceae bacterium]|nr:BlaI/MecI/CopY family transcriptional regulator [Akkermansiaceae bacterium]
MEILFANGPMTVADLTERMPDDLSRNGVRTFVTILTNKGKLTRIKQGREFIYEPAIEKEAVANSALGKLLEVFFNGSLSDAVAARFSGTRSKIDEHELARLEQLISEARGKKSRS